MPPSQAAHERQNIAIAAFYAPKIHRALRRLYSRSAYLTDLIARQEDDPEVAEARMRGLLTPDPAALAKLPLTLQELYVDAYAGGLTHQARHEGFTIADALLGTVKTWDPWRPLDPSDARVMGGASLDSLLLSAAGLARDLAQTLATRIAESVARAVRDRPAYAVGARVRQLLSSAAQAELVATTEAARAQSAAAADALGMSGVPFFDWLTDADPCAACAEQADANPHLRGALVPPLHPNCRCSIRPTAL